MTFRLRLVLIFLVPCGSGGSILSLWGLLGRTTQIRLIFCSVFFISHCFQDTVPGSHEQSTISKKFKGLYLFNYLIELGETLYLAYLKDALFIQKINKKYFFEILIPPFQGAELHSQGVIFFVRIAAKAAIRIYISTI